MNAAICARPRQCEDTTWDLIGAFLSDPHLYGFAAHKGIGAFGPQSGVAGRAQEMVRNRDILGRGEISLRMLLVLKAGNVSSLWQYDLHTS